MKPYGVDNYNAVCKWGCCFNNKYSRYKECRNPVRSVNKKRVLRGAKKHARQEAKKEIEKEI